MLLLGNIFHSYFGGFYPLSYYLPASASVSMSNTVHVFGLLGSIAGMRSMQISKKAWKERPR
jgi:hypothetical protein